MAWRAQYTKKAHKQLLKLDQNQRIIVLAWIDKNLNGAEDSRNLGGSLAGDKSEYWRYRVGTYRVLAKLEDDELVILAVKVGHRREVYK